MSGDNGILGAKPLFGNDIYVMANNGIDTEEIILALKHSKGIFKNER